MATRYSFNLLIVTLLAHAPSPSISATLQNSPPVKQDSLVYVNAVFRHGDRTLSSAEIYPNDNLTAADFEPYGLGQLTNTGKRRAYELGEILRDRYVNFLGVTYEPGLINARCTDVDRTKMTLQLVLASLFPPVGVEKWSDGLNWQPIPYNYVPQSRDNLLMSLFSCPLFGDEYDKVLSLEEVRSRIDQYRGLMSLASKITGRNISTISELAVFGVSLSVKEKLGIETRWPKEKNDELCDAMDLQIDLANYNPTLKRRNGGILLLEMIRNMRAAMNASSVEKIALYSSHDLNVMALAGALGISLPQIAEYTSAILLELHSINGIYYVKILHYLGIPEDVIELTLPHCDVLCPFDRFVELLRDVKPTSEDICGGEIIDDILRGQVKTI